MGSNDSIWSTRFESLYKCTVDNKIRVFQFKFIYRRVATEKYLFDIKQRDSPLCNICKESNQTISHLFIFCKHSAILWKAISQWLRAKGLLVHPLSTEELCFGYVKRNHFHLINTVLTAKYFIYTKNTTIINQHSLFSLTIFGTKKS